MDRLWLVSPLPGSAWPMAVLKSEALPAQIAGIRASKVLLKGWTPLV
jgi:hypothetical protein